MVSITNADLEIYVTENSVTTVIWKDNARVLAFGDVVRITDRDGIRYEFLYTDVIAPTSPAYSSAEELADEINTYLITIPGGGGGGSIDLETNGTPNGDQTKLNLVEGTNMTITDDGFGNITFDASGGGGGGTVTSVNSGININVDNTNPAAPIINSLSDRYRTSSTTSNSVSNGSKSFTVDLNLSYIPLQEILVVHNPANHMHGEVTSYNPATGALVVDIKHHTGSGTYTSWVINLDGTPVDALSGSGSINEIAYFTGAQTLSSLAVATYPSLTELSYVKGVTSAIQTQINGKLSSALTNTNIFVGNASNVATGVAMSGDATIANTGALTIASNLKTGSFGTTVDGYIGVIQPGVVGYVVMPYAGTITGWSIAANVSGSIRFDIWKANNALPTVANTIVASAKPALTSVQYLSSTTLTGWTTTFIAGDVFAFFVETATTIKNATISIRVTKS